VVSLGICAAASGAIVAAAHLPWFGDLAGDPTVPQFSALSGELVPPRSPSGLVPGTQSWGYLLVSWSALLTVAAVSAAFACGVLGSRQPRRVKRLLTVVGVASLILVALVVPELLTTVRFDLVSYAHSDWGALVGLGLAVMSSLGAWFAWATWTYPHRWGVRPSTE
jgi:hypothetical protein